MKKFVVSWENLTLVVIVENPLSNFLKLVFIDRLLLYKISGWVLGSLLKDFTSVLVLLLWSIIRELEVVLIEIKLLTPDRALLLHGNVISRLLLEVSNIAFFSGLIRISYIALWQHGHRCVNRLGFYRETVTVVKWWNLLEWNILGYQHRVRIFLQKVLIENKKVLFYLHLTNLELWLVRSVLIINFIFTELDWQSLSFRCGMVSTWLNWWHFGILKFIGQINLNIKVFPRWFLLLRCRVWGHCCFFYHLGRFLWPWVRFCVDLYWFWLY